VNHLHEAVARLEGWTALAEARGWPRLGLGLAPHVRRLSESYNLTGHAPARWDPGLQSARLLFFLPRDVLKTASWAQDAARAAPARPLKVLDLGAGLGATTIGFADARRTLGAAPVAEVTLVDTEPTGLAIASDVVRVALPDVLVRTRVADLRGALVEGGYDVVLLGQVLCELDRGSAELQRVAAHAHLLSTALGAVAPDGVVFLLEPALKAGTRHLQAVRDALVEAGRGVASPCPHVSACPMLARPQDWCHGWADGVLPEPLQPVAREAGLRWEGLTAARLVLTPTPRPVTPAARAVGPLSRTKGRSDVWWCTTAGTLAQAGRLDRHASTSNAAWDGVVVGDSVRFDGAGVPPVRVGPDTVVTREPR
jgi:SAM-dependent methyltransferase